MNTMLDGQDKVYMSALRDMVITRMKRHLANIRNGKFEDFEEFEPGDERVLQLCDYVEKALSDNTLGEWRFIKINIPGYPISPCYGTVFVFEYDGEKTYYGWDRGRYEIGFFFKPEHIPIETGCYILAEDILKEPIGTF